jgi:hypothetical protein
MMIVAANKRELHESLLLLLLLLLSVLPLTRHTY